VEPEAHPEQPPGERPLDLQRARHSIARPAERGDEAVALALLDRPHPVEAAHELVDDVIQLHERRLRRLGVVLPRPR
jgi:hypothetical protein